VIILKFSPNPIIWSADLADEMALIKASANLKKLDPGQIAIKLDRLFFERKETSKRAITWVQEALGFPVFDDAKIIEIPDKCEGIAIEHLCYEPWMLNIMAGAISTRKAFDENTAKIDALKRFADACLKYGTKPCVVTVLTSKDEETIIWEYGTGSIQKVLDYVGLAVEFGFTDVVCSPKEIAAIRGTFGDRIDINTPGVRLPGSSQDDQSRVDTPYAAIKNGATRLVIGRDLSRDNNFNENLAKIMANIEGGD
jgi:orotidine-5'-phosphate decarboxylase